MVTARTAARLLTVGDLCDMLTISESTVRRLIDRRQIPFLKVGGGIRFRQSDIDRYLDTRTVRAVN